MFRPITTKLKLGTYPSTIRTNICQGSVMRQISIVTLTYRFSFILSTTQALLVSHFNGDKI